MDELVVVNAAKQTVLAAKRLIEACNVLVEVLLIGVPKVIEPFTDAEETGSA